MTGWEEIKRSHLHESPSPIGQLGMPGKLSQAAPWGSTDWMLWQESEAAFDCEI